ncbi:hypothetical protein [Geothrix sp.]|jgi:hypothetical protein|uniref:hypothetical protein n=1 Tax=Geothrix sp. TaxID=1962974 RepID=UPI0025C3FCE6|nr:hypothetical protein [Geothrix sp.]
MASQVFLLARADVRWRGDGERIYGSPAEALDPSGLNMARDLKSELIALLGITEEQRGTILRRDPKVDLEGLARYRQCLEIWEEFTRQEQAILQGRALGLVNLKNLAVIRRFSGGLVGACWQEYRE